MKKRLFDEDDRHTEEALVFDNKVNDALKPLFREMVNKGYSKRDISTIITAVSVDMCVTFVLGWE